MERGALLLYLQNVRDLEIAKYRIEELYDNEMDYYKNKINHLFTAVDEVSHVWPESGMLKLTIVMLVLSIALSIFIKMIGVGFVFGIFVFFSIIFFILFLVHLEKYSNDKEECDKANKEADEEHEMQLAESQKNRIVLKELEEKHNRYIPWLEQEYKRVTSILNKFYSMNILPSQYRNLSAVCYIYDYMSTSKATFEETLIHEHMENGIQRLESKLSEIMYHIENVVYETRCMRAENRAALEHVISQNNAMLDSLQRIEGNSANAADYAQLAANYSKANAYFSAANYLKNL